MHALIPYISEIHNSQEPEYNQLKAKAKETKKRERKREETTIVAFTNTGEISLK